MFNLINNSGNLHSNLVMYVRLSGRHSQFFGFVGMILYGGDAFLKYKAWKSGAATYGGAGVPPGATEMGMEAPAEGGMSPTSPNANYPAY